MNDRIVTALIFINSLHPAALAVLFAVLFAGSVFLVPWAVVKIPADYFKSTTRRPPLWHKYPPLLRMSMMLAKNLLGLLLFMTGLVLLVLPGPGILTMVMGLLMLDVPGKFRFERWLLSHKFILQPVNWLRTKKHQPPLRLE